MKRKTILYVKKACELKIQLKKENFVDIVVIVISITLPTYHNLVYNKVEGYYDRHKTYLLTKRSIIVNIKSPNFSFVVNNYSSTQTFSSASLTRVYCSECVRSRQLISILP